MFNRPFDDQSQIRIRLESEAKLYIQEKIKDNSIELVWSYILKLENSYNPHDERRKAIQKWQNISSIEITETPEILALAHQLSKFSIKPKDALHVASALEGKADYFLTTDDRLLSSIIRSNLIKVLNPVNYIKVLEK
ncbi:MAG: PIN domain-containing protein [Candidatus Thiosymbion ectosymbiont of Robbea hypermnestra]|nr:PIN domain-containing protein [Candidatus Thiosymbion ectosymbiont of Robbea hypermnestra]